MGKVKVSSRDTVALGKAMEGLLYGGLEAFTTSGALDGRAFSGVYNLKFDVPGGDGFEVRRAFADVVDRSRLVRAVVESYGRAVAVYVASSEDENGGAWFSVHGERGSVTTSKHRNLIKRALESAGFTVSDLCPAAVARDVFGVDLDENGARLAVTLAEGGMPLPEAVEVAAATLA